MAGDVERVPLSTSHSSLVLVARNTWRPCLNTGSRATIQKIANNSVLAANEIRVLREEVRSLRKR